MAGSGPPPAGCGDEPNTRGSRGSGCSVCVWLGARGRGWVTPGWGGRRLWEDGSLQGDAGLWEIPRWRAIGSTSENSLVGSFTSGETIDWQVQNPLGGGK